MRIAATSTLRRKTRIVHKPERGSAADGLRPVARQPLVVDGLLNSAYLVRVNS